jgi:hypothetical protein
MPDIKSSEILLMLLPLVAIQFGLAVYCIADILKKGTKNLTKPIWIIIVLLFQFTGSIAYLIVGRKGAK